MHALVSIPRTADELVTLAAGVMSVWLVICARVLRKRHRSASRWMLCAATGHALCLVARLFAHPGVGAVVSVLGMMCAGVSAYRVVQDVRRMRDGLAGERFT